MKSTAILSCADRVATYFDGLAAGCSEAAESSDLRVWELMLSVLKLVRQTIADIEREAAEV
ncbi:MAG TPA: hypothetical protein VN780_12150 [Candidatus Eisenbacteria bacterium]|jgi:hypothetical protein|nr:hypothetical protein [Candidatus Eisenbacteria bacterium]